MPSILPVPAFSDNYIWLLHDDGPDALVVDPGDSEPVNAALRARGLRLAGILVTHHHPDHTGGIAALLDTWGPVPVRGPRSSPAAGISHPVDDGDALQLLGCRVSVLAVPGHTLDHIAYCFEACGGQPPALFCGDTLFAGGCGRVFEGNPAMMHASLSRLAALPPETRVYCAHEYTLSNLRFARAVEPANEVLREREQRDAARRERGEPTVPSTIALEAATNPFLRSGSGSVRAAAADRAGRELRTDAEVFAVVRSWKDDFR